MHEIILALVNRTSLWVINIVMLAIGAAVLIWVWSAITVLWKNVSAQASADKMLALQSECSQLKSDCASEAEGQG